MSTVAAATAYHTHAGGLLHPCRHASVLPTSISSIDGRHCWHRAGEARCAMAVGRCMRLRQGSGGRRCKRWRRRDLAVALTTGST
ncbi:hypothetical protein ACLOJK_019728, partial [Asimina triloba]